MTELGEVSRKGNGLSYIVFLRGRYARNLSTWVTMAKFSRQTGDFPLEVDMPASNEGV